MTAAPHIPGTLAPLAAERRWLVWRWEERDGRRTKVPYRADDPTRHARSNDPETWGDHASAIAAVTSGLADGIGYALASGVIGAFDLDDALDAAGEPLPWAWDLVRECGSYVERTVGGNGLRILGFAEGGKVHRKFKVPGTVSSVEAYRQAERYIVVTGAALEGYGGELRNIDGAMDALVGRLDAGRKASTASTADSAKPKTPRPCDGSDLPPALFALIRDGVPAPGRSEKFFYAVGALKGLGYDVDDVEELFTCFLTGIAEKYEHRLRAEIERAFGKTAARFEASDWFEEPDLTTNTSTSAADDPYPLIWHGDGDDEPLAAWLVDEMLFEVGTALLSGQWGTYKTFCALDLSAAVMVGGTFAGRQVKRKGGVLWLAVEGQGEVRKRLAAVAQEKIAPAIDGAAVQLDPSRLPFVWVKACPKLSAPNALAEFGALIGKAAAAMKERFELELALVIVDTLSPAAELKDADDTAENQHVMSVLKRTAQRFGTLVCAVDHMGKDTSTGTRNSSVKEADVDSVVALIGERDLAGNVAKPRVAMRKNRGAPTGWQAPFRTRIVSVVLRDEVVTTLVIDWGAAAESQTATVTPPTPAKSPWTGNARILRDAMERALDAAGRLIGQAANAPEVRAVDADKVRAEFYSTYPADSPDAKRQAFNRLLKDAVARALIGSREIEGVDFLSLRSDHPQPAADQAA